MNSKKIVLVILIPILVFVFWFLHHDFGENLSTYTSPDGQYKIEVNSIDGLFVTYGVKIYVENLTTENSSKELLLEYPIAQDLRTIVKHDISFTWDGEEGNLTVNGESETANIIIGLNKKTNKFYYKLNKP